jgi:hypothetical protein
VFLRKIQEEEETKSAFLSLPGKIEIANKEKNVEKYSAETGVQSSTTLCCVHRESQWCTKNGVYIMFLTVASVQ